MPGLSTLPGVTIRLTETEVTPKAAAACATSAVSRSTLWMRSAAWATSWRRMVSFLIPGSGDGMSIA